MNEPKRRGRPPKTEGAVLSHEAEILRRKAQGFALRVWSGQSDSVPRAERIARVQKALERQGMSMEGVEL
jgi:hypothetical protein